VKIQERARIPATLQQRTQQCNESSRENVSRKYQLVVKYNCNFWNQKCTHVVTGTTDKRFVSQRDSTWHNQ